MSKLDLTVKKYLLSVIDNESYSDESLKTNKEKIDFFFRCFKSEYGFRIRQKGELSALREYLSGLPTCINIDFYNWDILKLNYNWGQLDENSKDADEDKIIENWWNFCANKLLQLYRGTSIPKELNMEDI